MSTADPPIYNFTGLKFNPLFYQSTSTYVTTNTQQTIYALKQFTAGISTNTLAVSSSVSLPSSSIVQSEVLNGYVDLVSAQTVAGSKTFTNNLTLNSGFYLNPPSGSNTAIMILDTGNSTGYMRIFSTGSANYIQSGLQNATSTATLYITNENQTLTWITCLASNGYVGINKTTPLYQLEVNGDIASSVALLTSYSGTAMMIMNKNLITSLGNCGFYQGGSGDTMINSSSGQAVRLSINNTEYMRVHSTGKVGINTTSPSYQLDVNGDIAGSNALLSSYGGTAMMIMNKTLTATIGNCAVYQGGNGDTMINGALLYSVRFSINNVEYMRVHSNGFVGINNTSPSYQLDVTGDGHFTTNLLVGGTTTSSGLLTASSGFTVSTGTVSFPAGSIATSSIASGFVDTTTTQSIAGAKTFTATHTVNSNFYLNPPSGSNTAIMVFDTGNSTGYMRIFSTGSANYIQSGLSNATSTATLYITNENQTLTWITCLASNGYVGINKTAPTVQLDVNGDIASSVALLTSFAGTGLIMINRNLTTSLGNCAFYQGGSGDTMFNASTGQSVRLSINNSECMRVHSTGKVGINNTSPSYQLDVVGDGRFTSNLSVGGTITLNSTTSNGSLVDTGSTQTIGGAKTFTATHTVNSNFYLNPPSGSNTAIMVLDTGNSTGYMRIFSTGSANYIQSGLSNATSTATLYITNENATVNWITCLASNGYVGVNKTAPTVQLDVNGDIGNSVALLTSFAGTGLVVINRNLTTSLGNCAFYQGGSGDTMFNSASGQALRLSINNSECMRVHSTGKVGINNSGPSYQLDVTGDGRFTTNLTVGGTLSVTSTTTFTGIPSCSTAPTTGSHLTNKTYVDTVIQSTTLSTTQPSSITIGGGLLAKAMTKLEYAYTLPSPSTGANWTYNYGANTLGFLSVELDCYNSNVDTYLVVYQWYDNGSTLTFQQSTLIVGGGKVPTPTSSFASKTITLTFPVNLDYSRCVFTVYAGA